MAEAGDQAFPSSSMNKPSQDTEDHWIWARNMTDVNNMKPDYSTGTTKCGKWLIFESISKIDETWSVIKSAVECGKLGFLAKVATVKDKEIRNTNPTDSDKSVICVYTYDWTDEADVMRVRQELRELGFTNRIPYKSDADTLAGNYRAPGKRVSKYFC